MIYLACVISYNTSDSDSDWDFASVLTAYMFISEQYTYVVQIKAFIYFLTTLICNVFELFSHLYPSF